MTSYDVIFKRFLRKIEDIDLPKMSDEDADAILMGYLETALANIYFDNLRNFTSNFENRNDEERVFDDDLSSNEIEIISMYMASAWYEPRINSIETTKMYVGTNSQKWQDQNDFQEMMMKARDYWRLEARKLYRNRNVLDNSYLRGENNGT